MAAVQVKWEFVVFMQSGINTEIVFMQAQQLKQTGTERFILDERLGKAYSAEEVRFNRLGQQPASTLGTYFEHYYTGHVCPYLSNAFAVPSRKVGMM